jgi:predicted transcriptional regulator
MNKLNILINDYNRYIRRANQSMNLIKKQDEAQMNKHLSVMPRNVINNMFYFLESEIATIYKQEIKRNKGTSVKEAT